MSEWLKSLKLKDIALAMTVVFYGICLILLLVVFILSIIWGFG